MSDFVEEFLNHSIPVGAIDIDSAWSTGFNNFIVDTQKFPDMEGLVRQMHDRDIKVILWATSMVNTDSSNYAECIEQGFDIKNAINETDPLKWWHGKGVLLDYTNEAAVCVPPQDLGWTLAASCQKMVDDGTVCDVLSDNGGKSTWTMC